MPSHLLFRTAVLVLAALSAGTVSAQPLDECPGPLGGAICRFLNSPVKLDPDPVRLDPKPQAFFELRDELSFHDSRGRKWVAPPETLTDGASIPKVFIPMIGERRSSSFINAAAMHDAYCGFGNDHLDQYKSRNWEDVHRMFYDALIVNGTPRLKAKIMFAAVYLGGPRWNHDRSRDLGIVSSRALRQEMEWCMRWIKRMDPSRERIVQWMKSRESDLRTGNQKEPDWDKLFSEDATPVTRPENQTRGGGDVY